MNQINRMMERVTRDEALEAVRKLIRYLGDDPDREGLIETPERVLSSFKELYAGYHQDPATILQKTFPTQSKEMVLLSNIELYSTCEHHMLPFVGKCHIAYLPNQRVIGLSKLARLMEIFARRLQIQEELTHEIATALNNHVVAHGVAVMIEAKHMCMSCRGINKQQSVMTTTAMVGGFEENRELREEFYRRVEQQSRRNCY